MQDYRTYMDAQQGSTALHSRLLALGEAETAPEKRDFPQKQRQGGHMMKFTALAACAALLFGLGWQSLAPANRPVDPVVPPAVTDTTPAPTQTDPAQDDRTGFVAAPAGEETGKLAFPAILGVDYSDATHEPELAASLAFPQGSYWVELSKEDIQKIFWGAQGKPPVENPKTDTGDFPLFLMHWQGYTIAGRACYDGSGALWRLAITGEKGEDSFTLTLCPGHIPPECCVVEQATTTTVLDTAGTSR